MSVASHAELESFARRYHLLGLTEPSLDAVVEHHSGYSVSRAQRFLTFQERIRRELLRHRVITRNPYTAWFAQGRMSRAQVKAFIVQFSVFSNRFLVAQLYKTINATSLVVMHASKEILANEIGVVFRGAAAAPERRPGYDYDPELVSTEGSVEGGTFRHRAAHFEWLMRIAERLGLGFHEIGKPRHGTPTTLYFCDELLRLYGSEDDGVSQAASYAVENWAAAGFWDDLVQGLVTFNGRTGACLPLAFFTWHSQLEAQHARHTQEELEELYFNAELDEDGFIGHGNEMLDGVWAFWEGLDEQRRTIC